jgi:hypothetical protein
MTILVRFWTIKSVRFYLSFLNLHLNYVFVMSGRRHKNGSAKHLNYLNHYDLIRYHLSSSFDLTDFFSVDCLMLLFYFILIAVLTLTLYFFRGRFWLTFYCESCVFNHAINKVGMIFSLMIPMFKQMLIVCT